MKQYLAVLLVGNVLIISAAAGAVTTVRQQHPRGTSAQNSVVGEIVSLDKPMLLITVKIDSGAVIGVRLGSDTVYLRITPDNATVAKTARIELSDLGIGDRVYIRGRLSDDQKTATADQLIVMNKTDVIKKHEEDREAWRRGVAGVVQAVDGRTGEIHLALSGNNNGKPTVIVTNNGTLYRRYADNSIKFSDTELSSFGALKIGDQARARGDKSNDGTRFIAQELVFGSFQTIGGTVVSVSSEAKEVKIKLLGSNKPMTIICTDGSMLRRIPTETAPIIAKKLPNPDQRNKNSLSATDKGPAGAGDDLQTILERLPGFDPSGLKPGELIVASGTKNKDPTRLTAIMLIAGMDPVLKLLQSPKNDRPTLNLSTGLPAGAILSIGQP